MAQDEKHDGRSWTKRDFESLKVEELMSQNLLGDNKAARGFALFLRLKWLKLDDVHKLSIQRGLWQPGRFYLGEAGPVASSNHLRTGRWGTAGGCLRWVVWASKVSFQLPGQELGCAPFSGFLLDGWIFGDHFDDHWRLYLFHMDIFYIWQSWTDNELHAYHCTWCTSNNYQLRRPPTGDACALN